MPVQCEVRGLSRRPRFGRSSWPWPIPDEIYSDNRGKVHALKKKTERFALWLIARIQDKLWFCNAWFRSSSELLLCMESVRFSVATSNSTSRLHIYTFQCSKRDTGLFLLRRKTTWARPVGSWKKEEAISGLAWSVARHLVHVLPQARRDRTVAVNNGRRTARPSTIRLRCCVAWHMAASSAACGLDCVISEHHGRLERRTTHLKYSRSTVTVIGRPARPTTWCVESACVMRCARNWRQSSDRLASLREHPLSLGAKGSV